MKYDGELFCRPVAIAWAALAILISAPAFAQQKPVVVEANAVAGAAAKAVSVINKSGSYVLNKNITASKSGFTAILITVPNVTLDLQGFGITSTVSTTANGIDATGQANIVIRNGIVTGFGGSAVIAGNAGRISGLTVTGNGSGISCEIGCLARDNAVQNNLGVGMTFSDATSGYLGNILQGNDGNSQGSTGQVSGGSSLGQNLCNGSAC
jgi:hypothetical protein